VIDTRAGLFVRLSFIGQFHFSRSMGWTADSSRTLKKTGEV
jgi:hypothetical protein